MKSILLLIATFLLLPVVKSIAPQKKSISDDQIYANVSNFFKGTYRITSEVKNGISNEKFNVIDEVSSTAKTNVIRDYSGSLISCSYIVSEAGIAKEQYLDVSNNISYRNIGSTAILFKDYYASPLEKLTSSSSNIAKYFSVEKGSDSITYVANDLAMQISSNVFNSFFSFVTDKYSWDTKTVKEGIKDLKFTSDLNGNPTSLNFKKVKKDCYGGLVETYSSKLETIDSISSITKNSYSGSAESKSRLENALSELSTNLNGTNFSQTTTCPLLGQWSPFTNYYEFADNGYGLMLCDIGFEEQTYGTTYLGMIYDEAEEGYYMIGVSPDSYYYGATSNEVEKNLLDCIPLIRKLSVEHFVYDEATATYNFDLDNFIFNDNNFSADILKVLFGINDPIAFKFGYYFYDTVDYILNFHNLAINFNEDNSLKFTLNFTDFYGEEQYVSTTFGDFGTVDLANHPVLGDAFRVIV